MILTDYIMEEIARSERIVRDGQEVVPRFRIFSSEGQFVVFVQLPDALKERERRLKLVARFMAWKMAAGVVLSAEVKLPEGIASYAVTRHARMGAVERILRGETLSFGELEWLDQTQIGSELAALLPQRHTTMTIETLRELGQAFGEGGEMPAYRLAD